MISLLVGLLGGSLCRGAYPFLTTMPNGVGWSTLLALAAFEGATRGERAMRRARFAILGVAMAWLLPLSPVPPPGGVRTASLGRACSGDMFSALERIDADPARLVGASLSVSGEWTPASAGTPPTVSRRVMACCAADSVAVGFDVYPLGPQLLPAQAEVTVTGVLSAQMLHGELRYALQRAQVHRQHVARTGP